MLTGFLGKSGIDGRNQHAGPGVAGIDKTHFDRHVLLNDAAIENTPCPTINTARRDITRLDERVDENWPSGLGKGE